MQGSKRGFIGAQRGISLTGLIFVLAVLGALLVFGGKVLPTFTEYRAALDGIKNAKATSGSNREMQMAFDKTADINDIKAIAGRDLVISKETGETEISFAYEKRIPIAGNVSLLIDYAGTTDKSGRVGAKPAAPAQ
ncbi:MAG TPA: DUF4845 domain-containing protein [Telluria sp.]|nr:DUF4845 domain-containing protein [Telluria sp.]